VLPASPDALAIGAMLQMVEDAGLPLFKADIKRLAVFQKAALEGVPVNQVKGDRRAGIAWRCYQAVGREILKRNIWWLESRHAQSGSRP